MDTAKFKAALDKELAELTEELKALGIHNPEVKEDWVATPTDSDTSTADWLDNADRVEDWDERRSTLAALETRYNNINRALKKIEDGTYGICEVSGEPIEEDRLNANPDARTCKKHMNDTV